VQGGASDIQAGAGARSRNLPVPDGSSHRSNSASGRLIGFLTRSKSPGGGEGRRQTVVPGPSAEASAAPERLGPSVSDDTNGSRSPRDSGLRESEPSLARDEDRSNAARDSAASTSERSSRRSSFLPWRRSDRAVKRTDADQLRAMLTFDNTRAALEKFMQKECNDEAFRFLQLCNTLSSLTAKAEEADAHDMKFFTINAIKAAFLAGGSEINIGGPESKRLHAAIESLNKHPDDLRMRKVLCLIDESLDSVLATVKRDVLPRFLAANPWAAAQRAAKLDVVRWPPYLVTMEERLEMLASIDSQEKAVNEQFAAHDPLVTGQLQQLGIDEPVVPARNPAFAMPARQKPSLPNLCQEILDLFEAEDYTQSSIGEKVQLISSNLHGFRIANTAAVNDFLAAQEAWVANAVSNSGRLATALLNLQSAAVAQARQEAAARAASGAP
jgi:hypothetical protein